MNININQQCRKVKGTLLGEYLVEKARKYDRNNEELRRLREEQELREKQRMAKIARIMNIVLWPLYFVVGVASYFFFVNDYIPFFVIGIIVMLGITIALLSCEGHNKLNAVFFSLISLIGGAFFWQLQMWWWLVGTILYLVIALIVFLSNNY